MYKSTSLLYGWLVGLLVGWMVGCTMPTALVLEIGDNMVWIFILSIGLKFFFLCFSPGLVG